MQHMCNAGNSDAVAIANTRNEETVRWARNEGSKGWTQCEESVIAKDCKGLLDLKGSQNKGEIVPKD